MPRTRDITETEEYYRFVSTLYEGRPVLFLGLLGQLASIGVAYWATWDWIYVAAMVFIAVACAARIVDMERFSRARSGEMEWRDVRKWEWRYIAGSAAVSSALSGVAGYSIYTMESSIAMVAGMAVVVTVIVSLVGRNFGTTANINVMTVAGGIPFMTGGLFSGDPKLAMLCVAFAPLFPATARMARGIRELFARSIADQRDLKAAKDLVEAALTHMPHGLVMLDALSRINVANGKAAKLLMAESAKALEGRRLEDAVREGAERGGLPEERSQAILVQVRRLLHGKSALELVEVMDGLFLEVSGRTRRDGIVLTFEDVTERVVQQRKATHLARYDILSGLPNRAYMGELVDAAIAGADPDSLIAFSVFDVDRFKQVNDTMGHSAGDDVIRSVGRKLEKLSRGGAIVARLGGDEFVLAMPGLPWDADVTAIMDRMYGELTGFHQVAGKRMRIAVSGGVFVCPSAAFSLDHALTKADHALYVSKKSEGITWTLFDKEMDRVLGERLALRREFREALRRGSLDVVYQPILSPDARPVGFEALARWRHPERGMISPSEFVAIAEEDGLVGELTRQVLEAACYDCASWPDGISVSVNLSAADLAGHEIVDVIGAALGASGLAPARLQVEVTETMIVADRGKSAEVLRRIREMGVKTALDDFGMGYSSLSYLGSLPLDKVKVDRCFVEDVDGDTDACARLKAIVSLVSAFGMQVIVEGVERAAQLDAVNQVGGVSAVQGYAFGAPMPAGMVPGYLSVGTAFRELDAPRITGARGEPGSSSSARAACVASS